MESQPPVPPEYPPAEPAPAGPEGPPPTPPPGALPLPWEQPGAPLLQAFFATLRLLLFRPREAFPRMAVTGSYSRPVFFALIAGVLSLWVSAAYTLVFGDPMQDFWSRYAGEGAPDMPRFATYLFSVFAGPFVVALGIVLGALVYHLFLLIYGGSAGGLGATFRVVCYSVAANVWGLVPFVGGAVGTVWGVVILILGLAAAHRISVGKASAAVLTPIVLCCACCTPLAVWRVMSRM